VILAWIALTLAVLWVAFAYVGYPLVLLALARLSPRPLRRGDVSCAVSVVIAAHDGGRELPAKLDNLLAQECPGKLEVIVSSDGSRDDTEDVARRYAGRGVRLVASREQRGKEAAQAAAIAEATGELLVFTDVSAQLEPGALRALLRPFADPSVGCVSSEDLVESEGGEGAYVRYEMALRRLETEAATLIGLSGSLFAARRALCTPWPVELASDFRMALEAGRRGLRAVSEPAARARFRSVDDPAAEWRRKVRTVRRGIAVLVAYRDLLHPRYGRTALALIGHKLARFTSPLALVAALAASAWLATSSDAGTLLLALQLAGYGAGALALVSPAAGRLFPARIAGYFVLVNASILVGWAYHLSGRRAVAWRPTRR
jgi:cellulose synthase/poly-beta-1,6-N-acetylglucosamine synthase-like glycosyltransferase